MSDGGAPCCNAPGMLDPDALDKHAEALAAAVRMLGPVDRLHVLAILRALPLPDDESQAVLAYGLIFRYFAMEISLYRDDLHKFAPQTHAYTTTSFEA